MDAIGGRVDDVFWIRYPFESKVFTHRRADEKALGCPHEQPPVVIRNQAGGSRNPHPARRIDKLQLPVAHPLKPGIGARPQGSIRGLSQRLNQSPGTWPRKGNKSGAIIAEQAGGRSSPDEPHVILQQTMDFRVFEPVTVAIVAEAVPLGRERQIESQEPDQPTGAN